MKWKLIVPIAAGIVCVAVAVGVATSIGANSPTPTATNSPVSGTGTAQVLPVASNPITNTSTAPGLVIVGAMAENNVDPATKQPIADRLQVQVKNTSTSPLTGFEIYYTMTDAITKKSESYYQRLTDLTLPAGATTTVFFDGEKAPHHYPYNRYSIYRQSKNRVDFEIEVSATGVAPAHGTAVKGAGTGEVVGG